MCRFLLIFALVSGCSAITDEDRKLARDLLGEDLPGCVFIQGSGGAGAGTVPVPPVGVPLGGGYGQGSIAAARGTGARCSAEGASVEGVGEVLKGLVAPDGSVDAVPPSNGLLMRSQGRF